MENPIGALLSSLGLLFFLYHGYSVWFKPKQYLVNLQKKKRDIKKQLPFLPNWLINFNFFNDQPSISIWWVRIGTVLALLMCIVGFIVSIRGPF